MSIKGLPPVTFRDSAVSQCPQSLRRIRVVSRMRPRHCFNGNVFMELVAEVENEGLGVCYGFEKLPPAQAQAPWYRRDRHGKPARY